MVESTGRAAGDLGTRKKGDFVVTIGGTEKRIVFEMKHKTDTMFLPGIRMGTERGDGKQESQLRRAGI